MRLLELVFYLLKCHGRVTIKELSETFNVSTKTIQRDLDKLCILGIPITIHRGKNGGVEIDKNYVIAKQVLKQSDYEALITSLYIGEQLSDTIKNSYLIDKFRLMEPQRCSNIINHLNETFIVDFTDSGFNMESDIYKQIDLAMKNKSFVQVQLPNELLNVIPISYVLKSNGLYLYAYHKKYSLIELKNISKAISLNEPYTFQPLPYKDQKQTLHYI